MNWTIKKAKKQIERKRGIVIGKEIRVERPSVKTLCAISFLVREHKFVWAQ